MKQLFALASTFLLCLAGSLPAFAQDTLYRDFKARRVNEVPKIDGKLDEAIWTQNPDARTEYFFQLEPDNGAPASFPTEVHITYSDAAIYIGMRLFDPAPDSIPRELGMRDDFGRNADQIIIAFDTYGNGQNAFGFGLTSAGVQLDLSLQAQSEDPNWDAVWNSAVGFEEDAWIVEMEIPYMALRFPKKEVQSWKMNILRTIKRKNERSFYSFVDNSQSGLINQFTPLHGLENIMPPLRLSLTPFVTSYLTYNEASGNSRTFLTGGMDLKYGINESFTLDMSLIPDFGQVQSDNVVLNLSPFEVRFDENRPFFTEGTELFDKGGLFYSRRVGQSFGTFEPELAEKESITGYPNEAPLLNATKVSGRTKGGLGVGFFNSITNKSYATVKNGETGETREVMIDPVTNFNVFVLDQNLKNNSNISLINTNVQRASGGRDANVTGMDFRLRDSTNTYQVSGFGAVSHLSDGDLKGDTGYRYNVNVGKVSGRYQFELGRFVKSHNYNPNDMGFQRSANEITHYAGGGYHLFKPWWKFNRLSYRVNLSHSQLYKPREFVNVNASHNLFAQLKNFWMFEIGSGVNPVGYHDYFEARVAEQLFYKPAAYDVFGWMRTDNRKQLSFSMNLGTFQVREWDSHSRWIGFGPRYRVSDRLSIDHKFSLNKEKGDRGFVRHLYEEDELQHIVMGRRDVQTISNRLTTRYTFNNRMGLSLRVRHYWSKVRYDKFFSLRQDGKLDELDYTGKDEEGNSLHNTSFNAFNVDLVYQWQIGPGSFVNVVWKDAVFTNTNRVDQAFGRNFSDTFASDHNHNFSVKLIYFIDYLRVKNSFK